MERSVRRFPPRLDRILLLETQCHLRSRPKSTGTPRRSLGAENPTREALMKRIRRGVAIFFALGLSGTAWAETQPFPEPEALRPNIEFWLRIYSEIDSNSGLLHDTRHMDVVYEVLRFPENATRDQREEISEQTQKRIAKSLRQLSRGQRSNLSPREKQVLQSWPKGVRNETLREAASRVRFQRGQADRFKAGLVRSGRWRPHIETALLELELPVDLAALPHVESSYNPKARSRLGAMGLWQFTRPTGQRFMRVDHVVDERLDPFLSSLAAARLLELNYQVTGNWPLAITAYNHGAGGVRRAVATMDSDDIAVLVEGYNGPYFGFASRNFYAEFIAARRIHLDPERFFEPEETDPPIEYEVVTLETFVPARAIIARLPVSEAVVRQHNPALLETVWSGAKHIPEGFSLRIPRSELDRPLTEILAGLPDTVLFAKQIPDRHYTVRKGDALSRIAARYGLTQRQLIASNGLRNPNHIRIGQRLKLPMAQDPSAVEAALNYPGAKAARGIVRVRPGDTLSEIASRHGISTGELAQRNHLGDRDQIRVGQILRLSKSSPTPPSEESLPAPPIALDQTDLVADPSNYRVDRDGTIEVQASETLGHYAWLDVSIQSLRERNRMTQAASLQIGERFTLELGETSQVEFERRRMEHHRSLQEDFFTRYEIVETRVHRARAGDTLWILSERKFKIPLWLLRQYNPDLGARGLQVGDRVTVPRVRRHDDAPT